MAATPKIKQHQPMTQTNLFKGIALLILLAVVGCSQSSKSTENDESNSAEWTVLFDGKTLDGWEQKNGTATYEVVDGTIVGTTSDGSPNSFLCTAKSYGDFELTFEVKVDSELNSGVQIRSITRKESIGEGHNQEAGRVIGPQVEIAYGDDQGGLSGYIWREATGDGWMSSLEEPVAHKYLKNGQWNEYRILAQGPTITTWVNGNQVENVTDASTYETFPKGFIGLQVHGIRKGTGPFQVAWRNIKIREF